MLFKFGAGVVCSASHFKRSSPERRKDEFLTAHLTVTTLTSSSGSVGAMSATHIN